MAGSYSHVVEGGMTLLDNMGDAHEAIEELLFLVLTLRKSEAQVDELLSVFNSYCRGDADPSMPDASGVGAAYLETRRIMSQG